jgi:ParB/RepB/Spo0J family partition protein
MSIINTIQDIPLDQIRRYTDQPRKHFSRDSIQKLANSIRRRGQETPGTLRQLAEPDENGARFELIDGERRFRACGVAGVPTFRAIITEVENEDDQYERSVVSNFGREDHPPMEIAAAIKRLRAKYTVEETAERLAKSVGWVFLYQALLGLHPDVQAMINPALPEDQQLKVSIATRLARKISDHGVQLEAAKHIVSMRLPLREADLYMHRMAREKSIKIGNSDRHDQRKTVERFISRLAVDSEMVLSARQIDFKEALGSKTFAQLRSLIATLDVCIENINGIREAVSAVYEVRDRDTRKVPIKRSA